MAASKGFDQRTKSENLHISRPVCFLSEVQASVSYIMHIYVCNFQLSLVSTPKVCGTACVPT